MTYDHKLSVFCSFYLTALDIVNDEKLITKPY